MTSPNIGIPLLYLTRHSLHWASTIPLQLTAGCPASRAVTAVWPSISSWAQMSRPRQARAPPPCPKAPPPVGGGECLYFRPFGLRGPAGLLQGGWELSQPLTVGGVGLELGPEPGPGG